MRTVTIEIDPANPPDELLDIPWDRVVDVVGNTLTNPEMVDSATPHFGGGNTTVPPSFAPYTALGKVAGKRFKARIFIEEEEDEDEE